MFSARKYALAVLCVGALALSLMYFAQTAYGQRTSSSGGSTTFTSRTAAGTTGFNTNAQGRITSTFSTNCQNCSAGGGSFSGGGGNGGSNGSGSIAPAPNNNTPSRPVAQPLACTMTSDKPVLTAGATTNTLRFLPHAQGPITLTREGSSGTGDTTRRTLAVPDGSRSFVDTVNSLGEGVYTYRVSYGSTVLARSQPVEGTAQLASLITGASQVAAVTSHGAATPGGAAGGYSGGTGNWGSGGGAGSGLGGGGGGGAISTPSSACGQWVSVKEDPTSSRSNYVDKFIPCAVPPPPQTVYSYGCTVEIKVVNEITQCNDGIDNSDGEDALKDEQDPGCHTDADPKNPTTYDPNDDSETNPPADMKPTLSLSGTLAVGRSVQVSARAENIGTAYAQANDLVFGYRNVSSPVNYCNGSNGLCFTTGSKILMRLDTYGRAYDAGQERVAPMRVFTPAQPGVYEFCAVADYNTDVSEGASGEANNVTCRSVTVTDTPVDLPTITGPITLTADPTVVRRGNTSGLTWNTGGRLSCTITGTNGHTIPVTGVTGVVSTSAINSQTVYTLRCTDESYEGADDASIRILPVFQEF